MGAPSKLQWRSWQTLMTTMPNWPKRLESLLLLLRESPDAEPSLSSTYSATGRRQGHYQMGVSIVQLAHYCLSWHPPERVSQCNRERIAASVATQAQGA